MEKGFLVRRVNIVKTKKNSLLRETFKGTNTSRKGVQHMFQEDYLLPERTQCYKELLAANKRTAKKKSLLYQIKDSHFRWVLV